MIRVDAARVAVVKAGGPMSHPARSVLASVEHSIPTYAPSGGGERFCQLASAARKIATLTACGSDGERTVPHAGKGSNADMLLAIVGHAVVLVISVNSTPRNTYNLVCEHENVLLDTDLSEGLELGASENLAGRVVRSVDDDDLGFGCESSPAGQT